jgi:hypothetical protein
MNKNYLVAKCKVAFSGTQYPREMSKRKNSSQADKSAVKEHENKKEKHLSPEEFLFKLQEDYKELLSAIPDDDPAIFIRWVSMARVHQVCAIAGSPVAQGGNPQASMTNMRAFFRGAVGPAGHIVTDTNQLFVVDHLRTNDLANFQNQFPPLWVANCVIAGLTLGDLFIFTGTGVGEAEVVISHFNGLF